MAIHKLWRLSDGGANNLGLSCTDDGLVLGRTPLIERYGGRFVVRDRNEIERLLKRVYRDGLDLDRLMPALATVASAMNANDQCLARIAAVHLRIPDLPCVTARDDIEAEDLLIKYGDWNPALHPRTGTPPNPGWFAPTGDSANESSPIRFAQNDNPQRRSDATSVANDNWVRLPPGDYIDELADFVEWIANANPEDEKTIRAEIKRYYFDVEDIFGGQALHRALSDVLEPGISGKYLQQVRRETLDSIVDYAKVDPAEMGQLRALLAGGILSSATVDAWGVLQAEEATGADVAAAGSAEVAATNLPTEAWKYGWAKRGKIIDKVFRDKSLPPLFRVIDNFTGGTATSIKSIDLNAATYQDAARLMSRLNKYVDVLGEYDGGAMNGAVVESEKISGRTLHLIIPKGSMTSVQHDVIEAA